MIYGINFGAPPIPNTPRTAFRKFPAMIRRVECNHDHPGNFPTSGGSVYRIGGWACCLECKRTRGDAGGTRLVGYRLQGLAQTPIERDLMIIQASNGTRRIWVYPRQTPGGTWYGIYTY